ncbi:MAG: branched-chain amino acid aminotransferase [Victivallales bacterium]|jgi:branched-chain amino acid aminotransferase|nr:branched-chain amino acid aminotransferase [Victivallales bacterium]
MDIDWGNLGFEFLPTRSNIRFHYADGKWDNGKLFNSYDITLSVAANALHYGQAIFEGGKAFCCKDGKVRIFRPDENAKRLNVSASHLLMPEFPVEKFVEAVKTVVKDNIDFVPPYGTGGSLYIRPVMFGTTSQIGVGASLEYELIIMVVPVGAYYKGGIKPVDAMISRDYDRAAPHGTGHIKAAGNYAASLISGKQAKSKHCAVALFLDPATHTFVDEFGTSNFLAITKDGKYVTTQSDSILASITNKSLMTVAADLGMTVERRKIRASELADFAEVAACGTAVVLTPVGRIFDGEKVIDYHLTEIGPGLKRLYDEMTGIQVGERPDKHGWLVEI